MGAPEFLTWDGDVASGVLPYRPATDDLGGDNYENDAEGMPDAGEFPSAEAFNQLVKQVAAANKVIESAKIEVRFNTGAPFVQRATGPGLAVVTSLFSVVDNGLGDTTVTWPANTFPTPQISPSGLTPIFNSRTSFSVEEVTNGIRVRTWSLDGSGNATAADIPWTIHIN